MDDKTKSLIKATNQALEATLHRPSSVDTEKEEERKKNPQHAATVAMMSLADTCFTQKATSIPDVFDAISDKALEAIVTAISCGGGNDNAAAGRDEVFAVSCALFLYDLSGACILKESTYSKRLIAAGFIKMLKERIAKSPSSSQQIGNAIVGSASLELSLQTLSNSLIIESSATEIILKGGNEVANAYAKLVLAPDPDVDVNNEDEVVDLIHVASLRQAAAQYFAFLSRTILRIGDIEEEEGEKSEGTGSEKKEDTDEDKEKKRAVDALDKIMEEGAIVEVVITALKHVNPRFLLNDPFTSCFRHYCDFLSALLRTRYVHVAAISIVQRNVFEFLARIIMNTKLNDSHLKSCMLLLSAVRGLEVLYQDVSVLEPVRVAARHVVNLYSEADLGDGDDGDENLKESDETKPNVNVKMTDAMAAARLANELDDYLAGRGVRIGEPFVRRVVSMFTNCSGGLSGLTIWLALGLAVYAGWQWINVTE